jgi:hypothetical protein
MAMMSCVRDHTMNCGEDVYSDLGRYIAHLHEVVRINYVHHCLKQDVSNIRRKERFLLSICMLSHVFSRSLY